MRFWRRGGDVLVVAADFTIENGLLTPTLKLKRNKVLERFRTETEALYTRRARSAEPDSVGAR